MATATNPTPEPPPQAMEIEQYTMGVVESLTGVTVPVEVIRGEVSGDVVGIDPVALAALIEMILDIVNELINNCPQRGILEDMTTRPAMLAWFRMRFVRPATRGTRWRTRDVANAMREEAIETGRPGRLQLIQDVEAPEWT